MADIGPIRRRVDFEPMPETVPTVEPVIVPDREKVPA